MEEYRDFLICCGMLWDELELAMEHTGRHPEIVWLEKGLHDSPAKLHQALQNEIDQLKKPTGRAKKNDVPDE